MGRTDYLDELRCCMIAMPVHYLQDEKLLSCGHMVCAKCIVPKKRVVCGRCSTLNEYDLDKAPVLKIAQGLIASDLETFSKMLYDDFARTENEMRCKSLQYCPSPQVL
jgi:hypothetical protein